MALDIDTVFRDNVVKGDIHSGAHDPDKAEIRALLKGLVGGSSNPSIVKQTKAALDAVTPASENYGGLVLNDSDATKNGYYYRSSSTWVKGRGFPDTFAQITLGGTTSAQTGTVAAGVSPADVLVYFATVSTDNTGPMTLSISGETARDVVNAAGNALSAGEWTGTVIFFLNGDGDYQLLFDAGAVASAAQSATDAETAQAAAELARDQALAAVSNAFPVTRADLKALDTTAITSAYLKEAGREVQFVWRTGDYSAEIAGDTAETTFIKADAIAATSGAWVAAGYRHDLIAAPNVIRTVNSKLRDNFNLLDVVSVGDRDGIGGDTLDEAAYMSEAFEFSYDEGVRLNIGEGVHRLASTISAADAVHVQGEGNNGFTSVTTARGKGTWLHFDHTGVGLQLGTGAAVERHRLHDLGFIRNQPTPDAAWAPTANDYDISLRNSGIFLERPFFYNSTKAMRVWEGNASQVDIQSPRGQCFDEIFRVDETYDVFRVSDAHFWPYWSLDADVVAYMHANLTNFALVRCDNPKIKNFFSIYSRFGVYFSESAAGKTVRAKFTDTTFDSCNIGVCTDAGTDGVTAEFSGLVVQGPTGGGADGIGALIQGDNAHLVFVSPDFAELSQDCIRIGGTGNVVRAQAGGRATSWNKLAAGFPVIDCQSGNTANVDGEWTLSGGGSATLFGGSGTRRYGVKQVGQVTIPNGQTSPLTVNMPRNFGMPPKSVQLTFHSGLDTITKYYADGFNNSQFNLRFDATPTADLNVGWVAFYD